MHIIHRVSVDAHNRIDTVECQAADPKANAWVGAREVVPVIQVVDEIMSGGKVAMAVPHGPGSGPWVTVFADESGHEWIKAIATAEDSPSLHDLPRL